EGVVGDGDVVQRHVISGARLQAGGEPDPLEPVVHDVPRDRHVVHPHALGGVGGHRVRLELDGGPLVLAVVGDDVVADGGPAARLGVADLDGPPAGRTADVPV